MNRSIFAAALLLVLGCTERTPSAEAGAASAPPSANEGSTAMPARTEVADKLSSRAWVLVAIGSEHEPPPASGPVVLQADAQGKLNGVGGCNRYHGTYELDEADSTKITFGPVAATRMACPGPSMETERRYFEALERVRRLAFEGDGLILSDVAGQPLLRYRGETEDPRFEGTPAGGGDPGPPEPNAP